MTTYCTFFLVPFAASLAGLSDYQVRDDNFMSPDGRLLLLKVCTPETAAALRMLPGTIDLGANLDAPVVKCSPKQVRAMSLSGGSTTREKFTNRFNPQYDPFA